MIVGFTGTSKGCNRKQLKKLKELLLKFYDNSPAAGNVFHHGDCIGADAEADTIAKQVGYYIEEHPPSNFFKRAYCIGGVRRVLKPKPYLERNRDIVEACDVLIACPESEEEVLRSGTWATVRYAQARNKHIVYVYP